MTAAQYRQRLAAYDAMLDGWRMMRDGRPDIEDDIADLEKHRSQVAEWAVTKEGKERRLKGAWKK